MRETGHLEFAGRIKDMINRGGEKVYPAEVENLLFQHPNVADAQVLLEWDHRENSRNTGFSN